MTNVTHHICTRQHGVLETMGLDSLAMSCPSPFGTRSPTQAGPRKPLFQLGGERDNHERTNHQQKQGHSGEVS